MTGFTSIKDMFDGGGAGGSGSEYSLKSHDEYKNDYKAKHGKDDPNASSHSGGSSGNGNSGSKTVVTTSSSEATQTGGSSSQKNGFVSLEDMFDGGGMGGSGSKPSILSHQDYLADYKKKQAVGCVLARTICLRHTRNGS